MPVQQRWTRLAAWFVSLVAGGVFGVAGTIGQAYMFGVLPVGLIVAVLGITGLVGGLRLITGDRWTALACGLGAVLTTMLFSGRGPGGSVVVPAPVDASISTGIIWTFAVPVVVAIVVGWPSVAAVRGARTN